MKKIVCIAIGIVWLLPISLYAVTVTHLYQADLPVTSQSDDERAQAVRQAFLQLLVKLTGDQEIDKKPAIKEAVKRADYYISEYRYSLPTPQSATYFLHVHFEPADVTRLLRKAGIVYWGERRPLILVWLAVAKDRQNAEIIGSETPGEALDSLRHQGKRFALPLIFPLMDVADMSQVSADEVMNMTLPALQAAGKRYSPNAYLVGKIVPGVNGFESEWELVLDKNHWKWNISEATVDDIILQVLNQTSQQLIKYYGIRS